MIAQLDKYYIKTSIKKTYTRLISYLLFEGRPLTTPGQWINPIVFASFIIQKRLPVLKKVKNPIFILGSGRSGTTILGKTFSMHRDIGFLNEPKALWHSIYPYEDIIGSYSKKEGKYRLDENDITDSVINNANKLYGAYLLASCSKRVLDKYPELIFRPSFVQSIFGDARFIIIIRNGWDTSRSINNWCDKYTTYHKKEKHDWWGRNDRKWNALIEQLAVEIPEFRDNINILKNIRDNKVKGALEWTLTMREAYKFKDNPAYLIIKYEDLSNNPEKVINRILDFCELDKDEKMLHYASHIIHPSIPKANFDLPPFIEKPFLEMMEKFEYN